MPLTVIVFAAASIALAGPALAQSAYAPAGAQFDARFDRALSSKTMHDGDRFTLTEDEGYYRNAPPALKRAKIEGHLEHVTPASKDHRATLNVILDDVVLADGTTAPIEARITAARELDPRTHRLRDAALVLGADVTGHADGKPRATPRGALAGPGAGTAVSSRKPAAQIDVKPGTIVRIKLLEPITTVG